MLSRMATPTISSQSPLAAVTINPVVPRLRPPVHAYSDWRYTRRMSDDHSALSHPTQPSRSLLRCSPFASMCSRERMRAPLTVTTSTADVPPAGTTQTCCDSDVREMRSEGAAVQHPSHGCHRASTCGRCAAAHAGAASVTHAATAMAEEMRPKSCDELFIDMRRLLQYLIEKPAVSANPDRSMGWNCEKSVLSLDRAHWYRPSAVTAKRGLSDTSVPTNACSVGVHPSESKTSGKTLVVTKSMKSPCCRNRYHIAPPPAPT